MFGFGGKSFDPENNIGDLSGKVVLVTGGNAGLGKETILQLAKHQPQEIFLAARTESKAQAAINEVHQAVPNANIQYLPLDLSSFTSIKSAAEAFKGQSSRLDILINNAGIMATPFSLTNEGYEIQFGTNHMGHFLFTKLLLPTLQHTAEISETKPRIVNLSSMGHMGAPTGGLIFDQQKLGNVSTWTRYGQSKLSNILFTRELANRYPDITSIAVHPGVIITNLYEPFRGSGFLTRLGVKVFEIVGWLFMSDVHQGAKNQLWAATSEDAKTGTYYVPVGKVHSGSKYARDEGLAKKLWEYSEEEVKKHGY